MNVIVKLFEINQDYNSYWNWGEALPPIFLQLVSEISITINRIYYNSLKKEYTGFNREISRPLSRSDF